MIDLGYGNAILLGVVQGLTEFFPISSSGHLALIERFLSLDAKSPEMLLFTVITHVGTVFAVAIVFARSGRLFLRKIMRESRTAYSGRRNALRILGLAITATIPTGVIGLTFKDTFEAAFGEPMWIGICLIVTGSLLAGVRVIGRGSRGWRGFHFWGAFLVGVVQSMALLPGISRSGSTICMALFMGLRRRWAGEFSFLIATPAILGATALKVRDTFALPAEQLDAIQWGPIWVGGAVSLVVGVMALRLLLASLRSAKLHYFAPYCWVVGVIILMKTGLS